MDLPIFPIHKKPEYLLECCKLINSEWKRSETARLHSLRNSCDRLPVSLILLKQNQVIGHAKLSRIPSIEDACFLESVVIKSDLRGQGYGKYFMRKVEEYCDDKLKLQTIFLSTKGQEKFYEKLGYVECEPIQLYGAPVSQNFRTKFELLKPSTPKIALSNISKTYMYKDIRNKLIKK